MEISVPAPPSFSFRRTAASHGWSELAPFSVDETYTALRRVIDLGSGRDPVAVEIAAGDGALRVKAPGRLARRDAERVARDVRHIFRLDDDLEDFYAELSRATGFEWVARAGAGRLLRSPTVFEDLVKTICTTNCSWSLTKTMVTRLVDNLGRPARGGGRSFPTAEAMAEAPAGFYRDEMRSGYRAPYFKELAERVASGELDVESWLTSGLPTAELRRAMKRVKGVGDYAAENLLKLVGRYDVLALDSWVRATYARLHNRGRVCGDERIARHYARFGRWRGLALWCDMTKDWIEDRGAAGG
jgi:3-methyladenine DNA glycosylase/8-oxoguanine DNA glycosylase